MELLIILEMAQIFVVKYIDNDAEMTYAVEESSSATATQINGCGPRYELKSCRVQNYNMHEDLGKVDYLFCDKTGTLTKNELVFNKWATNGIVNPELHLDSIREDRERMERFKDFLRCVVLCHDVLLISLKNKSGE